MLAILLVLKRFVRKQLEAAAAAQNSTQETSSLEADSNNKENALNESQKTRVKRRKLMKIRQSSEFKMAPDDDLIPQSDFVQVKLAVNNETAAADDDDPADATGKNDAFEEDLKSDSRIVAGLLDIVCVCWM